MLRPHILTLLALLSLSSAFAQPATYYRVWQGFAKAELSQPEFEHRLNTLMEETLNVYEGKALNQYLVAIPPKELPSYIPAEFALVALHNEKVYREIRSTPEGKAYGDLHWELFDKSKSKSAPFHNLFQDKVQALENNHAYDMFGTALDWTKGHNAFYLGLRKKGLTKEQFLKGLKHHLEFVTEKFAPLGLQGYIVIANENYEMAYLNWKSEEHMNKAFESAAGKLVWTDADAILEGKMFLGAEVFAGPGQVSQGNFLESVQ